MSRLHLAGSSSPLTGRAARLTKCARAFLVALLLMGWGRPAESQTNNFRSIGTNAANLQPSGTARVSLGSTIVTFSTALPVATATGAIGLGDKLTIEGEVLFILSRNSDFQVALQSPATVDHFTPTTTFTVTRSYNTLQAWEDDCAAVPGCLPTSGGGRGGDLVADNRYETGVAYNDVGSGAFIDNDLDGRVIRIQGSTVDATRHRDLTVAAGQRHDGTAGTGAVVDGQTTTAFPIQMSENFSRVDWFEIKNGYDSSDGGSSSLYVGNGAVSVTNVVLEYMLVYDYVAGNFNAGARPNSGGGSESFTVRNSIFYNGDHGVRSVQAGDSVTVENCTTYNMGRSGYQSSSGGVISVTNSIAMGSGTGSDFTAGVTGNNNLDEDGSAPGVSSVHGKAVTNQFVSIAVASEDLHLKEGADALGGGLDLSGSFCCDLDETVRPAGGAWDIGADELAATNRRSIGTAPDYTAGTLTAVDGDPVVTGSGTAWRTANRGRGDRIDLGGTDYTILSVDSETQLTLTQRFAGAYSGAYTISRQFTGPTALQDWEDCISFQGVCTYFPVASASFVNDDRREIGIAYDDSVFTSGVLFQNSTTDATRDIRLTVDPGNRHNGTAGTGVVLDAALTDQHMRLSDDYITVEWFEIKRVTGAVNSAAVIVDAQSILLTRLLIHDFLDGANDISGILSLVGSTFTLRNSFIYDGDRAGVRFQGSSGLVENITVYGMSDTGSGVWRDTGVGPDLTCYNTISVGNSLADFDGNAFFGSHNSSTDASAFSKFSGNGAVGQTAAILFVDPAFATADLHLIATATALESGKDLSANFVNDIDGQTRPQGVLWDRGADERPAASSCPVAPQAWFDRDWQFRKAIMVQSSQVTTVLTDFPVLIHLATDTELAAGAQTNGEDIVFTASDGVTKLSHEIEKFVKATGELVAWVKVPYLSSGTDTTLYMYYSNAAVGPQQDVVNVWDVDYKGVWHLHETAGAHLDSTSNNNDAVVTSVTAQGTAPGQIDGADGFTAASFDNIDVADAASLDVGPAESMTAEAWIKTTLSGQFQFVVNKKTGSADWQMHVDNTNMPDFWVNDGTNLAQAQGSTVVTDGLWHHLVARWDEAASTAEIFLDGVSDGSATNALVGNFSNNQPLVVGEEGDAGRGFNFDGTLDEVRFSKTARSNGWIQSSYNNQLTPSNFYMVCSATTAVKLVSFTATGADGAVELAWETGSELNNLGFHVYRATSEKGSYERVTAQAIPGLGSSPVGASYGYRDAGVSNGATYYYKLEDIETTGKTKWHGPVSARPGRQAPATGGDSGASADTSSRSGGTSLITYGEPASSSLRVLKRGPRQVVLELVTEGFYAEPQQDGSVRLEIPGFEALSEAGAAGIPVRRSWVEGVAGRKVKVLSVQARGVEAFASLRPSDAEVPEIVATREGTVRASRRRAGKAFRGEGLYPSEAARIVSVGFQGEVKKALVELAPLRWDRASGQLVLARRLVVRLSLRERDAAEHSSDGVRGRRDARRPSHDKSRVLARFRTKQRGLHGVRYEEVLRGRRGVRARGLRLSRQGETVAFHIEPNGNRFKPGSKLYFVSEGSSVNPYGREAVYELELGRAGDTMAEIPAVASGEPTHVYRHRAEWEENRYYQAALVDAPDVWLWDVLFAPVVKSYPFEVSALALSAPREPSTLSVWLQGVSDFEANPDHHVRVSVNGSLVAEVSWNGKRAKTIDVELLPGILQEGNNVLELDNVGDTEAAYSMVMLDRFSVEYPRLARTGNGRLEGRFGASGAAELSGFVAGAHVLDVSGAEPSWLVATELGADGQLRFRAESGRSYLAVDPEAVYQPVVEKPRASRLKKKRNRAEYLVIGPEAFLRAATPLLELRRRQGLKVKAVSIEEVYSEFGFGEPTPEAVKDFLSYAYHHWRQPSPRYVLLLGDGTFDFKDYLQTGVTNQVPPRMVKTSYLWTASDPSYAAVNGDDLLPDLAIGRLPAATVEQVQAMVAKILAYETGDAGVHSSAVVLVADNPDRAGNFEADARALAAGVLAARHPNLIFSSVLGTTDTRNAIVQSFDNGASLVSYMGHGGIHLWADENFFNTGDIAALQPQSQQPLLLTMNCLNGYFHFPYFNSLAEELVQARDKGAIAAFSPTGLGLNGPANLYHRALLEQLVRGGHERLGDAVMAAQGAYAETGAFPELLTIYHLLGDPALSLR